MEKIPTSTSLGKKVRKTFALGSLVSLGFLGSADNAVAERAADESGNKNRIEQKTKGYSLGTYYQKKFEQKDREMDFYREALTQAKEILESKGIPINEETEIELELQENKLVNIIVEGMTIPVVDRNQQIEEKPDTIPTKTVVSDEVNDFL